MRAGQDRDRNELPFWVALFVTCLLIGGATFRLANGVSAQSGDVGAAPLSTVERQALVRQATLRVAAGSCGTVTRGSGFVVGDWLVTNEHIVRGSSSIKADQPIDPVLLPIVGRSRATDLAAAPAPAAVSLTLTSSPVEIADRVLVAGHADGGAIEVQDGIVTNRVPGETYGFATDLLLIDVPTRLGYSGGPVMDARGDVAAVLVGFDRTTELTLAVPAQTIGEFLAGLPETVDDAGSRACSGR